ncbi:alpha/beta hydrolase [Psittacicella hinzii]|uniref:Xaa-Pro dipeptidyl-peptidase-like domain-containing protein n=1 Tax=Psittacicella hinzii TaxID=2028575 RepID=A0A3A1YL04_9GAMM|nr:alpha/beta hydrolase [Psittacicella hinzii]RIY37899.1 hypothetical protein CKF58_04450 [Psittacicella hinzii]
MTLVNIEPTNQPQVQSPVSMESTWDKTFTLDLQITHRKVSFVNKFGIALVADVYLPKNAATNRSLAAVAVSGPFGAVKEQSSGLYAHYLATQGLVTLAFDNSYTGESGGYPRGMSSADVFTEDFSAAVDFLTTLEQVNPERIGVLGICGLGGFALNAAAMDPRIKAVATSVMYDMTRAMGFGVGPSRDVLTPAQRQALKQFLAAQRTADYAANAYSYASYNYVFEGNQVSRVGDLTEIPFNAQDLGNPVIQEFADYYRNPQRGYHPRSINSNGKWQATMPLGMMNSRILSFADEINVPTLILTGEFAHSRYFAEDAYRHVGTAQKELVIVAGADHAGLYDTANGLLPLEKFASFFIQALK